MIHDGLYDVILPQMGQGNKISMSLIKKSGGIDVFVPEYHDPKNGDYIDIYWDGYIDKVIPIHDVSNQFPLYDQIKRNISPGAHTIMYTATDKSGNTSESSTIAISITDEEPDNKYPAPSFPDATNDVIDDESISLNNGTHILINPYSDIVSGDAVRLYVSLYDNSDVQVWSGYRDEMVNDADIVAGIKKLINAETLDKVSSGKICAHYQVVNSSAIKGISDTACATIKNVAPATGLNILVSTDAPVYDANSFMLRPFNRGVITGKPGDEIKVSVGGSAVFESNALPEITCKLDTTGEATFRLRDNRPEDVTVTARNMMSPNETVSKVITFANYKKGDGKIEYIANSTGARADGIMPCSIYLKIADIDFNNKKNAVTKVRVNVTGSALIDGYNVATADIALNSDFTAEIDVINAVAENISAELTLPESSGTNERILLSFEQLNSK